MAEAVVVPKISEILLNLAQVILLDLSLAYTSFFNYFVESILKSHATCQECCVQV